MSRRTALVAFLLLTSSAVPAAAQGADSALPGGGLAAFDGKLRLKVELKTNFRSSRDVSFLYTPIGVGAQLEMRTVDPGQSAEVSNVALIAEADVTPDISAKAEVHVIGLYMRNPTSSDSRVALREAWVRFGKKHDVLRPIPGTSVYLQLGMAPRFTKQVNRRLETYGLWGTAVGRWEEVGAEAGGSFGKNVYWRGSITAGNPVFMRDPNVLAGDNGTPERTPGSTVPVVYNSGFPILYDAKPGDVSSTGKWQGGGGLGVRFNWGEDRRNGVDLLGYYFKRNMAEHVSIHGTFYSGDLDLLRGFDPGVSLPIEGNEKMEYGANLELRQSGLQLYGQFVRQEMAGLVRWGIDGELGYRIPLNGLFLSGETPVINWVQPVVRVSFIDNEFERPGFVAPSFTWDWTKIDFGFRLGIVRGIDLTAEYARHDMKTARGTLHPDEVLVTLRAAF